MQSTNVDWRTSLPSQVSLKQWLPDSSTLSEINFHSNIIFKSSSTVLLTNYNKYFFLRKMRLSFYPHFFTFPLFFKKNLHFQYPIRVLLVFSWYPGILREIKGFRRTDPGIETCGVGQYAPRQLSIFNSQKGVCPNRLGQNAENFKTEISSH